MTVSFGYPVQKRLAARFAEIAKQHLVFEPRSHARHDHTTALFGDWRIDVEEIRATDAVRMMALGALDTAVVGSDTYWETVLADNLGNNVQILAEFDDEGQCAVELIGLPRNDVGDWRALRGEIVLTEYPALTERAIRLAGIKPDNMGITLLGVEGKVERMVANERFPGNFGVCVVSTGETVRANGLMRYTDMPILPKVRPVFVASASALNNPEKAEIIHAMASALGTPLIRTVRQDERIRDQSLNMVEPTTEIVSIAGVT